MIDGVRRGPWERRSELRRTGRCMRIFKTLAHSTNGRARAGGEPRWHHPWSMVTSFCLLVIPTCVLAT